MRPRPNATRTDSMSSFFFSSRRRHTRSLCDWSSDVCSSDLPLDGRAREVARRERLLSADHGQRASVPDVGGDPVQVLLQVIPGPVAEILEDDEVERLQLLLEDLRSEERRVGKE